jgi:hypothetical protein
LLRTVRLSGAEVRQNGEQSAPVNPEQVASLLFEHQSQFRACGNSIADALLIPRPDFGRLKCRVARVIDREEIRIDGVTLRVAYTFRPVEMNLHATSSTRPPTIAAVPRLQSITLKD